MEPPGISEEITPVIALLVSRRTVKTVPDLENLAQQAQ
jgi:hypothetical protein